MKRVFGVFTLIVVLCFMSGCGSSKQATVDVLETCKVIGSTIVETSISESKEYLTITFENGVFYCEDSTDSDVTYTIKVPVGDEVDVYPILKTIASNMTEEDFTKLEEGNTVSFYRSYKVNWYITKEQEGSTVNYVIK